MLTKKMVDLPCVRKQDISRYVPTTTCFVAKYNNQQNIVTLHLRTNLIIITFPRHYYPLCSHRQQAHGPQRRRFECLTNWSAFLLNPFPKFEFPNFFGIIKSNKKISKTKNKKIQKSIWNSQIWIVSLSLSLSHTSSSPWKASWLSFLHLLHCKT